MKKIALSAMLGMFLFSCTKTDVVSSIQPKLQPEVQSVRAVPISINSPVAGRIEDGCTATTLTKTLLAGQTIVSGDVTVTNDGINLSVTYASTGGWLISEIQLYVGEYAYAPQNNGGNPIPGRFPIKQTFNPAVSTYTSIIPLSSLPECFVVAAHAVVRNGANSQTGWAQGIQFSGSNWGMYFDYCKQTCP